MKACGVCGVAHKSCTDAAQLRLAASDEAAELRRQLDDMKGERDAARSAITEAISMVDEAFEMTGYFKIGKTSEQRIRLQVAAGLAPGPHPAS